jgi:hypothetical protein
MSSPHVRALIVLALAIVSACDAIGTFGAPQGGPYPAACEQWGYKPNQCEGIVERAMFTADVEKADVRSLFLLPFESQVNLGGRQVALVRIELATGAVVEEAVQCVGVSLGRACYEDASIDFGGGIDTDVPCAGEPPAGCATRPPTPDPDALAAAKPLRVASLDVPLDHEGAYEIVVGAAALPNGYLSERAFSLANPAPSDFWIDEGVRLEVRPTVAGRPPIGSIYRDPFDGPEPVTVVLVFDVTDLDAPAVLQVRDIVVR